MIEYLRGQKLELIERGGFVTIHWQQDWMCRHQEYRLSTYCISNGTRVPVFIQDGYTVPYQLKVDGSLQYGHRNGQIFLVSHNKEQKPYQHRFLKTSCDQSLYYLRALSGVDVTRVVGVYLEDVSTREKNLKGSPVKSYETIDRLVTSRVQGMRGGYAERSNIFGETGNVTIHQYFYRGSYRAMIETK